MKRILCIYLSLLLVSCYNIYKPKKPENLLSKDKMVEVIVDMALFSSVKGLNKYELQQYGVLPEDYIYEKHHIDSLQFALSNEYYTYDLDDYESIYERVFDSLQVLKTKFKEQETEEMEAKRKKDSIRRSNLNGSSKIKTESNRADMVNKKANRPLSKIPDSLQ